ncbi:DUF2059 domain-containing protein [Nostoc sp.]|uniref:DUF2059 domain-containing protein n=1 Tax=Nostoc sp. TaxID=1180 RepID=UPI002FFB8AA6
MKIKFCFIVTVVLSLVMTFDRAAFAQTTTNTIAPISNAEEIDKTNNIKKLLEISVTKNLFRSLITQLSNEFKSEYPQVPQKFWETFAAELNPDDLIKEMIPIYNKYFTNEEIKQLIAFYQTPVGQKTLNPQILQEATSIGIRYGKEVAQRALNKLEAEGYMRPSK